MARGMKKAGKKMNRGAVARVEALKKKKKKVMKKKKKTGM